MHCGKSEWFNFFYTSIMIVNSLSSFLLSSHLSSVLLKRTIQDATMGHCSIEDAGATLELAFRRAKYGSSFKLQCKTRHEMHLMELIDTVRKRHDGDQGFAVTREKGGLVCIGSNSWIKSCVNARSSAHTLICEDISCSTRNSVCAWIKSDLRKPNFLLASICVKESNHIALLDQFLVSFLFSKDTVSARSFGSQRFLLSSS
jgi:hypothetical protein